MIPCWFHYSFTDNCLQTLVEPVVPSPNLDASVVRGEDKVLAALDTVWPASSVDQNKMANAVAHMLPSQRADPEFLYNPST